MSVDRIDSDALCLGFTNSMGNASSRNAPANTSTAAPSWRCAMVWRWDASTAEGGGDSRMMVLVLNDTLDEAWPRMDKTICLYHGLWKSRSIAAYGLSSELFQLITKNEQIATFN